MSKNLPLLIFIFVLLVSIAKSQISIEELEKIQLLMTADISTIQCSDAPAMSDEIADAVEKLNQIQIEDYRALQEKIPILLPTIQQLKTKEEEQLKEEESEAVSAFDEDAEKQQKQVEKDEFNTKYEENQNTLLEMEKKLDAIYEEKSAKMKKNFENMKKPKDEWFSENGIPFDEINKKDQEIVSDIEDEINEGFQKEYGALLDAIVDEGIDANKQIEESLKNQLIVEAPQPGASIEQVISAPQPGQVIDAPQPGETVINAPQPGQIIDAPQPGETVINAPQPGQVIDAPQPGETVINAPQPGQVIDAPQPGETVINAPQPGQVIDAPQPGETVINAPQPGQVIDAPQPGETVINAPQPGQIIDAPQPGETVINAPQPGQIIDAPQPGAGTAEPPQPPQPSFLLKFQKWVKREEGKLTNQVKQKKLIVKKHHEHQQHNKKKAEIKIRHSNRFSEAFDLWVFKQSHQQKKPSLKQQCKNQEISSELLTELTLLEEKLNTLQNEITKIFEVYNNKEKLKEQQEAITKFIQQC